MSTVAAQYDWPATLWPHQLRGCVEIIEAIERGDRRIVLTAPTGMGKSKCMTTLTEYAHERYWNVALYCHRRMLFDQICGVFDGHNIEYGMRAAGREPALLRDVQLIMTPSEASAVYRKKRRELHPANIVLADELHAQGGDILPTILRDHYEQGAAVIGVTATPLDLAGEWDTMIVAGKTSEGRKCGALVPAYTYCPDTPDLKHIKNYRVGEDLTDKENAKIMMRPGVFGRVYTNWQRLNPEAKPTILFAPDVAGSIFFAEEFRRQGITAAHIDAKQIWLDGEYQESSDENRAEILRQFRNGEIQVLCNRFVLREGIDIPEVAHAIFACVFGSLKTYLQAGGRALRAHPSMTEVSIQDHGGNFVRHGSLNADREWQLDMQGYRETGLRQEAMREKPELEPIICPKCGMARLSGPTCPKCGHTCYKRSRMVVQINGDLKFVDGPTNRPRPTKMRPDTEKLWQSYYYSQKRCGHTFNQAYAWFFHEEHYWPPRNLPLMPVDKADWFRTIGDVPKERLS